MQWAFFLAAFAVAFVLGYFVKKFQSLAEIAQLKEQVKARTTELESHVAFLKKEGEEKMEVLRAAAEEKIEFQRRSFEEARRQAKQEFENLAQAILEKKSLNLAENHQAGLKSMLDPLDRRLKEFQERVEQAYSQEGRERFALKGEVQKLMDLNLTMSRETQNLTKALKGDSKVQGDWGEIVLEKMLENSGLREGIEFSTQSSFTAEDGSRLRPDVIVHLPDQKSVIIDSKVSLKAYELYCSCECDEERETHLRAHLKSLQDHVNGLTAKKYEKIEGLKSPDFVFMFIPIEAAYLLAAQKDAGLVSQAWAKNVALVTSTTLFTNLKTIASIWRVENQNRYASEIAAEAGKLYDKFVLFFDDLEGVGKQIEKSQQSYQDAVSKLKVGPGNLIRRVEKLRELGATSSKRLRPELLDS